MTSAGRREHRHATDREQRMAEDAYPAPTPAVAARRRGTSVRAHHDIHGRDGVMNVSVPTSIPRRLVAGVAARRVMPA
jgi:hypothetical protein